MKKILLLGFVLLFVTFCGEKELDPNEITFVFHMLPRSTTGEIGIEYKKIKEIVEATIPNTILKLVPITAPASEYYTKVALGLRNDNSYDIIQEDSFLLQSDVVAGLLAPIPTEEWSDWTNYFSEGARDASTLDGKTYMIPWSTDIRGLYYSKKLFKEAGLPLNWKPKDWAEVLTVARTMKALDPTGDRVLPFKANLSRIQGEATTMQTFLMLLYGTEDKLFEGGKWVVDSKGLYDTLNFLKVLRDENLVVPNEILLTVSESSSTLMSSLSGDNGIRLDGTWITGAFEQDGLTNWRDIYGFTHLPTQYGDPNRPKVSFSGGWGLSLSAKSQRKEKAWEVMKVLASYDTLKQLYSITGFLSTRSDVAQDPNYQSLGVNTEAAAIAPYSFYRPANNEYPAISSEISTLVENIMLGMSIPTAIDTFAKGVELTLGKDRTIRKAY